MGRRVRDIEGSVVLRLLGHGVGQEAEPRRPPFYSAAPANPCLACRYGYILGGNGSVGNTNRQFVARTP